MIHRLAARPSHRGSPIPPHTAVVPRFRQDPQHRAASADLVHDTTPRPASRRPPRQPRWAGPVYLEEDQRKSTSGRRRSRFRSSTTRSGLRRLVRRAPARRGWRPGWSRRPVRPFGSPSSSRSRPEFIPLAERRRQRADASSEEARAPGPPRPRRSRTAYASRSTRNLDAASAEDSISAFPARPQQRPSSPFQELHSLVRTRSCARGPGFRSRSHAAGACVPAGMQCQAPACRWWVPAEQRPSARDCHALSTGVPAAACPAARPL